MTPPVDGRATSAEDYNEERSKVRSSVSWILKFGSVSTDPAYLPDVINDALNEDGSLKAATGQLLSGGWLQRQLVNAVFKTRSSAPGFAGVLEVLCRHGMYLLKSEDDVVTSAQLQENPVNVNAHLQLIDMLMKAVSSKLWSPMEKVVFSVKRFATFSASKDLPNNLEEALVLWLNKVMEKINLYEDKPDSEQIPVEEMRRCPTVSTNLDDMCDSCVLVSLLHYYCPDHILLDDIVLKEPMPISDALHNLQTALDFCYNILFPQHDLPDLSDFLTTEDFIQCHEELRANFLAFYAFLFYCLELDAVEGLVKPRGHDVNCVRKVSDTCQTVSGCYAIELAPSVVTGKPSTPNSVGQAASLAAVLPEVKSLISEATKQSFLNPGHSPVKTKHTSNLVTINSQSDSDLSSKSFHAGIPQKPLLPKRAQEERPHSNRTIRNPSSHSLRKSTSLHNMMNGVEEEEVTRGVGHVSKWLDNQPTWPYSPRSADSDGSQSSARAPPRGHVTNVWDRSKAPPTGGLLSQVEVDSDSEIEEILSSRTTDDDGVTESRASSFAWGGFVNSRIQPSRTSTARSNNAGDMTLETVRTVDYKTPTTTARLSRDRNRHSKDCGDETSSELTDVTTLLASGDSTYSSVTATTHDPSIAAITTSQTSPAKTQSKQDLYDLPSTVHKKPATETSYVVQSRDFRTVDSARAAGYPVISDTSRSQRSTAAAKAPTQSGNSIATDNVSVDEKLRDVMDRMKAISAQIRKEELERERRHRVAVMRRRGEQCMVQVKDMLKINSQAETAEAKNKEESSSDYSSKSPSPATSARNDETTSLPAGNVAPLPSWASMQRNDDAAQGDPAHKSVTVEATSVQQKLNQLQLSVERERQKRKVNELEKSIGDLHAELKNLENSELNRSSLHDLSATLTENTRTSLPPTHSPHSRLNDTNSAPQNEPDILSPHHAPGAVEAPAPSDPCPAARRSLFTDHQSIPHKNADQVPMQSTQSAPPEEEVPQTCSSHADAGKVAHEISVSYDSFSCQLNAPSCQSTPAKSPAPNDTSNPVQEEQSTLTMNGVEQRPALGFTILDENSPASKVAKKKEQFLLARMKKEQEQRMKHMEREKEAARKKEEAREQQELMLQKKTEEKEKRDRLFREYQERKKHEQDAALATQKPGIISTNSTPSTGKKGSRPKSQHLHTDDVEVLENIVNLDAPTSSGVTFGRSAPLVTQKDIDTDSVGSGGSEYHGPKLFKQLESKSNRVLINNALCHCCLPGKVNETNRKKTLKAMDKSEARHIMILFRDTKCQYRAIYSYDVESEKLHKISGHGPSLISPSMIEALYKYNSGRRTFVCVPSKTLSVGIDAITIKNTLWQHSRK